MKALITGVSVFKRHLTTFMLLERLKTKYLLLWNHEGFQKYFRNTGWLFVGRFLTLGISFFVGIYIARYLGPERYGHLNYVISFVGLFGFLASLGIDSIVSRDIVAQPDKKLEILGTGFLIKCVGGIAATVSTILVAFIVTNDHYTFFLIALFAFNYIPTSFNILESYFQSQVLSKYVVSSQVIANIISSILKILVIVFGFGLTWFLTIYIIETIVTGTFLFIFYKRQGNFVRKWSFRLEWVRSLLKDAWPLMLANIAVGVYMKIDQVMIKNMLGNEDAGIYAVAVKLSEVWYFIPVLITSSLSPAIVNAKMQDKKIYESRLFNLYSLMFLISLSIAVGGFLLAHPIIDILFGEPYSGAAPILQIYVWAGIGVFLGLAIGQFLLTNNLTKISFYGTLVGAIVNVVLNFLLIPPMGIKGAALATVVSYISATLGLFLFKEPRTHGKRMIQLAIKPRSYEKFY